MRPSKPLGEFRRGWVGPGMCTDDDAARLLASVLATDVPVVVDADGLTLLAQRPELVASPDRADTVDAPRRRSSLDSQLLATTGSRPRVLLPHASESRSC